MEDFESGNAYGLRLTMLASKGKGPVLNRILSTLTHWVDPSMQIIDVDELLPDESKKTRKRPVAQSGCLVTPALSVMLFVRETGSMCVNDVEDILKKSPWEFHHKVELQNKSAPQKSLAKQEFYKLTDDLPLFATCPVLSGNEHLRIHLYVHDFPAMVEFYRIITDTEIETSKPGFCIFEMYRQPGLDIQLSLKKSPYIYPVPIDSAYVSFNVKNIEMVKTGTNGKVDHMGGNVYTTRDPDGNLVVVYETDISHVNDCSTLAGACCRHESCPTSCVNCTYTAFDDGKSFKSFTESHDSGRYSDIENATVASKISYLDKSSYPSKNKTRERSEGYASSNSSKDADEYQLKQGKSSSKSKNSNVENSRAKTFAASSKNTSRDLNTSHVGNFTPVYI